MANVGVADNSTEKADKFLETPVPPPSPSSSSPSTGDKSWCRFNYFGPTYSSVVASLSFLCTGLLRAYTSPALLSIQNESSASSASSSSNLILVSASSSSNSKKDAISWIASTPPLASFLGTILSGPLLQHWGRKRTLVLLSLVSTVGWLLVGNSWSISALLSGRALTGLASGLATATAPLYISEIVSSSRTKKKKDGSLVVATSGGTTTDRRGLLPGVMLATGILLGFMLAHQIQVWRRLALIIAIFPGVLAFLSVTIPESPFWLLHLSAKKRESDDGKEIKFDLEMEPVVPPPTSIKKSKRKSIQSSSEKTGLIPRKNISPFSIPIYLRIGLLMLFQQWSGGNVLIYYLSEILTKSVLSSSASHTHHHSQVAVDDSTIHQASLIIALVQFIGFFLALPLIEHPRVGRRLLLLISSVSMMMAHLFLGFHFHLMMIQKISSNDDDVSNNTTTQQANYFNPDDNNAADDNTNNVNFSLSHYDFVVRVSSLAVLLSCYSIGLGPIPFLFIENSTTAAASKLEGSSSTEKDENSGFSTTSKSSSYFSSFASLVNHLALFLAVKGFPYLFHMDHHEDNDKEEQQAIIFHYGPDVTFWLFAGVCWITALFTFYCVPADHYSSESQEIDQVSSSS